MIAAAILLAVVSSATGRCFQMPEWFGSSLDHDTLASLSANTNQPLTKDTARAVYSGIDGYYERMAALEPEYFSRQGVTLRKANNVAFGVYSDSVTRDLSGDGLMLKGAAIAEVDGGIRRFVSGSDKRFCMPTATSVEAVTDGEWSQNTNLFAQAEEETVKAVYESMADHPVNTNANSAACHNLNAAIDAFNSAEPKFPYLAKPSITNDGQSSSLSGWYFGQWGRECRKPSDITYRALVADHHDSRGYLPLMDKVLNDVNPRDCIEVTNQYYSVENHYFVEGEGDCSVIFANAASIYARDLPSSSIVSNYTVVTQTNVRVSDRFVYGHGHSSAGAKIGTQVQGLYSITNIIIVKSTLTRPANIMLMRTDSGIMGLFKVRLIAGNRDDYEQGEGIVAFSSSLLNPKALIRCNVARFINYWKSDLCAAGKGPPTPTCIGRPYSWLDHYGKLRSLTTVGTHLENHVVTNWSFCAKTITFGGKPQSEDLLRMAMGYRAAAHTELVNVAGGDSWQTWIPITPQIAKAIYSDAAVETGSRLLELSKSQPLYGEVGFYVHNGEADGQMYTLHWEWPHWPVFDAEVPDNAPLRVAAVDEYTPSKPSPFVARLPVEVECAPVVIKQMTRHEWGNYTVGEE